MQNDRIKWIDGFRINALLSINYIYNLYLKQKKEGRMNIQTQSNIGSINSERKQQIE